MDARCLRGGLAVEYTGASAAPDDDEGWLQHGHPGRVSDPHPEDVFVEWHGLEDEPCSRWLCFDLPALAEISEAEYELRARRLDAGLPPIDGLRD